ncbi:Uncharacterised protein [uncultured archaeon]|nr:Uncharacterised protein [uncultured archaeon]
MHAWEHATSGLFMLDAATRPVIIFDSINSGYINRTSIDLSGHVGDAAVYTPPKFRLGRRRLNGLG